MENGYFQPASPFGRIAAADMSQQEKAEQAAGILMKMLLHEETNLAVLTQSDESGDTDLLVDAMESSDLGILETLRLFSPVDIKDSDALEYTLVEPRFLLDFIAPQIDQFLIQTETGNIAVPTSLFELDSE